MRIASGTVKPASARSSMLRWSPRRAMTWPAPVGSAPAISRPPAAAKARSKAISLWSIIASNGAAGRWAAWRRSWWGQAAGAERGGSGGGGAGGGGGGGWWAPGVRREEVAQVGGRFEIGAVAAFEHGEGRGDRDSGLAPGAGHRSEERRVGGE